MVDRSLFCSLAEVLHDKRFIEQRDPLPRKALQSSHFHLTDCNFWKSIVIVGRVEAYHYILHRTSALGAYR